MTSGNENERVGFYGRLRTFRGGQMIINGKAITIAPLSDLSGANLRGANLALAILPDGFLQGE